MPMTCRMEPSLSLDREPWEGGWQVRRRASGWLRFIPAAFLTFWLCGWLVGEVFAGGMLFSMAAAAFGLELPVGTGSMRGLPAAAPGAFAVAAFLSVWLAFWTFGGLMAMRELLHLVWGRETVRWDSERIETVRSVGPFERVKRVRGEDLRRIRVRAGRVEADTRQGRVVLATFGGRADREALCAHLRRSLAHWLEGTRAWSRAGEPFRVGVWRESQGAAAPVLESGWPWLGAKLEPAHGSLTRRIRVLGWSQVRTWQPITLTLTVQTDSDGDEHWGIRAGDASGDTLLHSSLEDPAPAHALGEWLTRHTGAIVRESRARLGERRSA